MAMRLLFRIIASAVDATMNAARSAIRRQSLAQVFSGPVQPHREVISGHTQPG